VNAGWTRTTYTAPSGETKQARVVYTSLGASEDLINENARRFLTNACLWAAGLEKSISESLDVSIVGSYNPSPYTNGAYYIEGVHPNDLQGWDSQIMPEGGKLAGVGDAKNVKRKAKVLANRPTLKKRLAAEYPELYGSVDD